MFPCPWPLYPGRQKPLLVSSPHFQLLPLSLGPRPELSPPYRRLPALDPFLLVLAVIPT